MKINIAKKHLNCSFCKLLIIKGDLCVRDSFKKEGRWLFLFYHPDCYKEKFYKYFEDKVREFKDALIEKRGSLLGKGRPPKFKDLSKRVLYRNLNSLLRYHKEVGNKEAVSILVKRIKTMDKEANDEQEEGK